MPTTRALADALTDVLGSTSLTPTGSSASSASDTLANWIGTLSAKNSQLELINKGFLVNAVGHVNGWTLAGTAGGSFAADTINGVPAVRVNSVAGNAWISRTIDLSVADGGALLFLVDITDPQRVDSIVIYLADSGFTKSFNTTLTVNGVREAGPQTIAVDISEMSAAGGMTLSDKAVTLRFRVNSAMGGGSVAFSSLYYKRKAKPKVIVGFDDNWSSQYSEAFTYMSRRGIPGTIYAVQDYVGASNYMTLAQLQEVYAAGWDIGNHTKTHSGVLRGQTSTGTMAVAAAQTPTSAFTLNGSAASDGVVTFDAPRHLVIRTTVNETGKYVTITGSLAGVPRSETLWLKNNWSRASELLYDRVTEVSISSAAAGAIRIDSSLSEAEIRQELVSCRDYLISNGMSRAATHLAYPFGEICSTGESVLGELGFKTARLVIGPPVPTGMGVYNPLRTNALVPTDTTTLARAQQDIDQAILRGATAHICLHKIAATVTDSTTWPTADFRALIDYIVTKRDADEIEPITISQWF